MTGGLGSERGGVGDALRMPHVDRMEDIRDRSPSVRMLTLGWRLSLLLLAGILVGTVCVLAAHPH